jgi:hypothetical protein
VSRLTAEVLSQAGCSNGSLQDAQVLAVGQQVGDAAALLWVALARDLDDVIDVDNLGVGDGGVEANEHSLVHIVVLSNLRERAGGQRTHVGAESNGCWVT